MRSETQKRLDALERRINTGDHVNHAFIDLVAPGSNGPQSLDVVGYEARFMSRNMTVMRLPGETLEGLRERCQEYAGQHGQEGCSMWLAITPNEI